MNEWEERFDDAVSKLKQERDELRVKIHLAKADAQDEWEKLEEKYESLKNQAGNARDAANDAGGDVKAAASLLMDELKKGYAKIRESL
jgi:seryl-tRNA synthetase